MLIVGFIIAGVIVYQATAPPPRPGEGGLSLSRVFASVRRAVHGNRGRAEVTHSTAFPVAPSINEIRVSGPLSAITVVGEQRPDIACDFLVRSTGFDEAEARRLADASAARIDNAGESMNLSVTYPVAGQQTGSITLKIPVRLKVRIEQAGPRTSITNVAGAEIVSSRGEATVKQVAGRVSLTHRGGRVIVDGAGSVKAVARAGADVKIDRVRGDLSLELQGGELAASEFAGPVEVETRGAELTLKADSARGPIRVNAIGGSVTVENARTELRVDGRGAEVNVTVAQGAPSIAIYGEGGEDIHVTPPPGGYRLDAITTGGHIAVPEKTLAVTSSNGEQRANGAVNGGGPTITVRSREGDIVIRGR